VAHNGNLVNAHILKDELEEQGSIFQTTMDSEVFLHLFIKNLIKGDIESAILKAVSKIEGAYSMILLTCKGEIIGMKDPNGFRPLALGKLNGHYVLSSETCAFDLVQAEFIRELDPGEIVIINEDGIKSIKHPKAAKNKSLCIFEYIYFARPDSIIDGKNVYEMRLEMGRRLAKETPADIDLVLPVPDSGVAAARGYADGLGVPFEMGIVRNHYVGRTFIEPTQEIRDLKVKLKLSPIKHLIDGKKVAIIDDSLVRGTTSKQIVRMLKEAGAKEVHMRIAAPEIKYPCRYGIDTPTKQELISTKYTPEEIAENMGADSLGFLSVEGLKESLGTERTYSLVSFDGNYFAGGNAETPGCAGGC
jgi:amidophosphoribosyltransferase